jgi:hypothetical protein
MCHSWFFHFRPIKVDDRLCSKAYYQDIIVDGFTYLFEIIYPENRIVVDYNGEERLVLLGIINTETGEELQHNELFEGFDVVKKIRWSSGLFRIEG